MVSYSVIFSGNREGAHSGALFLSMFNQVVLFLFLFQDDPLQRCANGKVDFQEVSASRESAEVYVLGTLVSGQFAP